MDYSVSVSLEFGAVDTFFIRMLSSACVRCQKSIRRQKVLFPLKKKLAYVRHKTTSIHINIIITHFYYLIYAKKSKNAFFLRLALSRAYFGYLFCKYVRKLRSHGKAYLNVLCKVGLICYDLVFFKFQIYFLIV